MVSSLQKLPLAVAVSALSVLGGVQGMNFSYPAPPWIESEFTSSPPVYPSPNATGYGWQSAFEQASSFVSQLTLQEKVTLLTGTPGPCVGNIGSIPRLGFNGLCLQDGPLAIRQADYASVFPAGITVAASWDKALAQQRGYEMASEFKAKGAHVILGPVAGPLGRSAYGGRNWEGFSPEPYLTGQLFARSIEGIQMTGLQATAKHFIAYEQETQRNPSVDAEGKTIESVSSNVDDQTMHEMYLWPFQDAVKAGVSAVMCSYNRVNQSYACANSKNLNGLLKTELGFQGYVMSDWEGVHAGNATIQAGLDMNMPGGIQFTEASPSYWGQNLTMLVNNGTVPIERVDDACRRIMTPYFNLQEMNWPPIDGSEPALSSFSEPYNYTFNLGPSNVDVRDDHSALIRELGAAGIVLLKNENNALPLKTPKNVGVFGDDAGDITIGLYFQGDADLTGIGYEYGVLPVGGGSGTGRFSFVINPLDAIKKKVASYDPKALVQYVLNDTLITDAGGFDIVFPTPPEVCLVFLKTWASEGYDRTSLFLNWNGTGVVETVAASCANTIVVTNSGGLNVLPFADHPNVTAILAAHYPGEEVGNSIVDVLWGDVNPSGKLPYTIAKEPGDYLFADITNSTALLETTNATAWQSNFEARLLLDYRWFDYFNESVQYEFGYGLSYTTFTMGQLSITPSSNASNITALPADLPIVPGGNPALWETLYTITATVTNNGSVPGSAVAQLYLGLPQPASSAADATPKKMLRGFSKDLLQPGESCEVSFPVMRRDLSYWDIGTQQWTIAPGAVSAMAGWSSRDIQAMGSFTPLSGSGVAMNGTHWRN